MLTLCISPRIFTKTQSTKNTKPKDSNICKLPEDEKWLETPATTAVSDNITAKMMTSFNFQHGAGSFVSTLLNLWCTCSAKPKMSMLRMKPKQADIMIFAVLLVMNVVTTITRLEKTNITSNLKQVNKNNAHNLKKNKSGTKLKLKKLFEVYA